MGTLIDGKKIAREKVEILRCKLEALAPKRVCFILFGSDPRSLAFIKMKEKIAKQISVQTVVIHKETTTTEQAIQTMTEATLAGYDGIVVQLPLPQGVDEVSVLEVLPHNLDIDMLVPSSQEAKTLPPVARAVSWALDTNNIRLEQNNIVILGAGRLVGVPVAKWLTNAGYIVAVVDEQTPDHEKISLIYSADIIISGIGVPHYIKPEMIKDGVVLIDAGTSESSGKLVGDIDPACYKKSSFYTPVPGGIGPMTVVALFENLIS